MDKDFEMENFIVSARKYRPATFDTVVGQASITTTLKNAIKNNHLAQAFLFCGPRGVGKTTCARILAKTINCFNITSNVEACNECESCVSFNNAQSLNIYELDAASNNSVEDIRGLVEQVRFAPQLGKKKIYIIDEVHMLSQSAFNAFLKTLEEPPSYAIFILATTEKHKIIPTILSRCQIFDFNRIQVEDIANHLAYVASKENITADTDALHIIAQKADGALRDSLSMFDQIVSFAGNHITYKAVIDNLNILDYDYYFKVTDAINSGNIPASMLLFNDILNNGFDGNNFVNGLAEHFRNLLVCKDQATVQLLEVSPNIREKYREQALKCATTFLLNALNTLNQCDVQYKQAKNHRLHVELALLKLCSLHVSMAQPEEAQKKNDPVALPINQAQPARPAAPQPVTASVPQASSATPPASVSPSSAGQSGNGAQTSVSQPVSQPIPNAQPRPEIKPGPSIGLKTVSIASALQAKPTSAPATQKVEREEVQQPVYQKLGTQEFSKDQLLNAWKKYADMLLKESNMNLYSTLTKREPVLYSDYTIELTIDNKVQEEALNADKVNFLGFLRHQLNNHQIQLKTLLEVQEVPQVVAYTAEDKFKKMVELNPVINDLKNKLDLDIN